MFNLRNLGKKISALPEFFGFDKMPGGRIASSEAAVNNARLATSGADFLSSYLSYRYYDAGRRIFFNDGNSTGFILEVSPIVGVDENLLKNLIYFFNDEMPENSYMHFLLVASDDIENILNIHRSTQVNSHGIVRKITEAREKMLRVLSSDFASFDGRLARDFKIYVSFSRKEKFGVNSAACLRELCSLRDRMTKKFEALGLNIRSCDVEDLIALVRDLLQNEKDYSKKSTKYDPLTALNEGVLLPLRKMRVTRDSIKHENSGMISKSYYVRKYPREFSLRRMIDLLGSSENTLLQLPARFAISFTVVKDIDFAGQKAIVTKGDNVIAAAEKYYSRNDTELKRDSGEWKEIIDGLNRGERLLTTNFSVFLSAPADAIDYAEQNLFSLYNIQDFRLEVNRELQLPALLGLLPLQQIPYMPIFRKFGLTRIVTSSQAAALLPLHAEWKGVPTGGVLLHGRRGQLFNWNPFYRLASGNSNVCIFGPSGGGKTVFLQEMTRENFGSNTRTFILDIGQSFAELCALTGGESIKFGKESGIGLNPFASFSANMDLGDREELLKCTKAILSVMCGIKSDDHLAAAELEKALVRSLEESNYSLDITGFAEFLERSEAEVLKHMGSCLYPYTKEGLYGKYFSGASAASFRQAITVFEFEEIKNDSRLLAIVLQILLMEITEQFLTGDRSGKFTIIVDEAWMLLTFAAAFFAAFGRTVRKYGGNLVICVQNYSDLQKNTDTRAILENSTWTVLLKQDEKGLESFKNSEAFKDMLPLIRSISLSPGKYSEMLLCATGVKVIGRLVLDNYSKILYSTDAADFNYLRNADAAGLGVDEAISARALEKYGSC